MTYEYIVWEDSLGCSSSWSEYEKEEDGELRPLICESIGEVIDESDRAVLLCPHRANIPRGEVQFCGDMVIPKSCIVQRRVIEL